MAQRDYVSRGRSSPHRRKNNRHSNSSPVSKTMVMLAVAVLVFFAGGLYFLVHNSPDSTQPSGNHPVINHELPPRPEERWSYIKELENRQITGSSRPVPQIQPPKNNGLSTQTLSEEQRQLLEQMQADMRQPPTELAQVPSGGQRTEDRGQKAEQIAPTAAPTPTVEQKMEQKSSQKEKEKEKEKEKVKVKEKAKKKSDERWSLQCGAFTNQDQAEQMRVELAFAGIESRISKSGNLYRVTLGPYPSRDAASKKHQQVKSIGVSNCITLGIST